ncbi:MAG: hypothetical protein IJL83_03960 [Clostridia bacterium]|nr:hypothetical protein [Clostridia bacterium]
MKAKKLLIILLAALIALFSLCACGGDETKGDPDKNGSVDDSYAASSDETQDSGESSGSSLNENYFQSSVML